MKGLSRKNAVSPRSVNWSLYKPEDLANKLKLPFKNVDLALEETGFFKAVRIREELIKWKVNLLDEGMKLRIRKKYILRVLKVVMQKEREVSGQLLGIRNILRISREKDNGKNNQI